VLAKLIWDLPSFLSVLESEDLSDVAQTQKKQISELLSRLQADHHGNTTATGTGNNTAGTTGTAGNNTGKTSETSKMMSLVLLVEDAEYMIMSCPSSSPSNEPADSPGTGTAHMIKSEYNILFIVYDIL